MISFVLSFIAGLLTTLSPCVFPVLPFVVGSALREHKLGPLGLATGLIVTFVAVGWSTAAFGSFLGIDQDHVRWFSAMVLVFLGLTMMLERLHRLFTAALNPISRRADRLLQKQSLSGFGGQFLVGCLLGALWSPCSGPTLGSAILLTAHAGGRFKSGTMLFVFGLGAALPLLLLSYGFQGIFQKYRPALLQTAERGKVAFGAITLAVGLFILTGADKHAEGWLLNQLPDAWISLITKF